MIQLRPMTSSEYPAYCDYFIDDYSREIAENYGHSMDRALELANQDLLRSFPNGLETNDHELLCIESVQNWLVICGTRLTKMTNRRLFMTSSFFQIVAIMVMEN